MAQKIIFDFGANNGDDVPYYLLKADLVVAVEANPVLCAKMRQRFKGEIDDGRLVVENCVLIASELDGSKDVGFYIHKTAHGLSQFPTPPPGILEQYERMMLPAVKVQELVVRYGTPYYVKIDIEHYDSKILEAFFKSNIIQSISPPSPIRRRSFACCI